MSREQELTLLLYKFKNEIRRSPGAITLCETKSYQKIMDFVNGEYICTGAKRQKGDSDERCTQ